MTKITLHYIWFEDYGCYKKQGINFSTKYHFEYDCDQEIINAEQINKKYINDFFGENIDLTTIVGANGTGKTLLLRFILDLSYGNIIKTSCVVIYEVNQEFCAFKYYVDEKNVGQNCRLNIPGFPICKLTDRMFSNEKYQIRDNVRFVYLTELFNPNQYQQSFAGGDDLSFGALLYKQSIEGEEEINDNPIVKSIHRAFDKQLNLLANAKQSLSDFSLRNPKYVTAFFIFNEEAFEKLYLSVYNKNVVFKDGNEKAAQEEVFKSEATAIVDSFFNKDNNKTISLFLYTLSKAIFFNIIQSFDFVINTNPEDRNVLLIMIKRVCSLPYNSWKKIIVLLHKIERINDKYTQLLNSNSNRLPQMAYIPINAKRYLNFMKETIRFLKSSKNYRLIDNRIVFHTESNLNELSSFYKSYKDTISIVDFLSFSWNLSSGETLLLNMFSKIFGLLKKNNKGNMFLPKDVNNDEPAENVIILLDEAEVSYHPAWQRKYLKSFLKFVCKYISNSSTHVQIIIATHSPIILSDVPKQSIVYLNTFDGKTIVESNEDHAESFASNIFRLYNDSFFLDDGAIGAFAEEKLKIILKRIRFITNETNSNDLEKILNEISLIGDPFIRNKMLQELDTKTCGKTHRLILLEYKRKLLEEEISKLKIQMGDNQ